MNYFTRTIIASPAQWLLEAGIGIGLDFTGFKHEITSGFKNHVIKRHGNPALHGRATITDADFAFITDIVKVPCMAIIRAARKGRLYIIYAKTKLNMTYIYFEQIFDSHRYRALRGSTFYKVTRPLAADDIKRIVTRNDKTDLSGAVILSFS